MVNAWVIIVTQDVVGEHSILWKIPVIPAKAGIFKHLRQIYEIPALGPEWRKKLRNDEDVFARD